MRFLWDPTKANTNVAKHQIDFETAELVWDDPHHKIVFDRFEEGEERWWAIGVVDAMATLVVVHIYPHQDDDQIVRISKRTQGDAEGAQAV